MAESNDNSISLNKYVSATGICSRREADRMIEQGRISINGKVARKGNRVQKGDRVYLDKKPLKSKPKSLYIAFNKPVGIVCTTDRKERNNIIDFIGHRERLFPIGRLDKPSQGLIFLTNDGDIVNKILRAGNKHEKEYHVTVDKNITPLFIKRMSNGLPILGKKTRKCEVSKINDRSFKIILTEGMNRQIRRMCTFLGYEVVRLQRIRIMNVAIGKLKVGAWRLLTSKEMDVIFKMVKDSSKTKESKG